VQNFSLDACWHARAAATLHHLCSGFMVISSAGNSWMPDVLSDTAAIWGTAACLMRSQL